MDGTTIDDLHGRLLRDTFGHRLSDTDAFLIFVLFHSSRVMLTAPVLTDRPGIQEVGPLSQRGVSAALASMWQGTEDRRAACTDWYFRWNGEWGSYEHAERLTLEEQDRLAALQAALERHPFVGWFEPED